MTNTGKLSIRRLESKDIATAVEIFYEQFPGLSWRRLGKGFIGKLIRWHVQYQPDLALVAEIDEGVNGFLLGATGGHREYYRQVLRFAFAELLLGSLLHPWLFLKPAFAFAWLDLLSRRRPHKVKPGVAAADKNGDKKAIICYVAVCSAQQGKGIGTSLKGAFEKLAFQAGCEVLSSNTEIDNFAARRMNEKSGWKLVRQDDRHRLVYYSKRLEKDS